MCAIAHFTEGVKAKDKNISLLLGRVASQQIYTMNQHTPLKTNMTLVAWIVFLRDVCWNLVSRDPN